MTIHGLPEWVEGQDGGALRFDGLTTYARVPDSPLLDGTDKLTIAFWVKPEGLDGNPRFIVSKRTYQKQNASYGLFFGAGNRLNLDFNLNEGSGERIEARTVFENGQWYHIMLVFDGEAHASQRARLYVNGTLDRDAMLGTTSIPDHASPLFVGIGQTGYGYKFKGLIDELSISRNVPGPETLGTAHQGFWTLEKWTGMPYKEIDQLTGNRRFYSGASSREILRASGKNLDWYQNGGRFRGLIEVPNDGRYTFWMTAKTAADLYLSTDDKPFAKRRIAFLSPDNGTGEGIGYNEQNQWDRYASQMSAGLDLEAGRKYYIEVLSQVNLGAHSQMKLAWASENGVRTAIPSSALSYYLIPSNDIDDDALPDDWEITNGLSPSDNGAENIERQGERGDFDGDGLTNREEYLLGTDPRSVDTDQDGRSDYDEVKTYRTNPSVADVSTDVLIGTVPVESYAASNVGWMLVDGGLVSESFRGSIEWDFMVGSSGHYILQAGTRIRGNVYSSEVVDVIVSIDGKRQGRYKIDYGGSHEAMLRVITPMLAAGTHRLKLEIDNRIARRTVQIDSLEILQRAGTDLDGNGRPDWVDVLFSERESVAAVGPYSRVSPFFIEGRAGDATSVAVNGEPARQGADEQHWYANVPLHPSDLVTYEIGFPSGTPTVGEVAWLSTNILDNGNFPVRTGDSLKLGAWTTSASGEALVSVIKPHPSIPSGIMAGVVPETTDVATGNGAVRIPASGGHHIRLSDSAEFDGTEKLGVSFWAKPDAGSLDGVPRGIVSKRQQASSQAAWSVFIFTGGRLFIDLDSGTSVPQRIDTGYIMTTQWQKIEIAYDGSLPSSQRVSLKVNGVVFGTYAAGASAIRDLNSNLVIGTLNANYSSGGVLVGFGGLLDDVRINRSIPGTQQATTVRLDFEPAAALTTQTNTLRTDRRLVGNETFIQQFDEVLPYTIEASHDSGASGIIHVPVKQAIFTNEPVLLQNTLKFWNLNASSVDPTLEFTAGEGLRIGSKEVTGPSTYRFQLYPEASGQLGVAARLYANGPIAGVARIHSVAMSSATQNDLATVGSTEFPGHRLIRNPLLITDLPPGGRIRITIFRAGVFFEDGSTVLVLTAEDLVNGIYSLRTLVPDDLQGGICHYIDVYDAAGNLIGRR